MLLTQFIKKCSHYIIYLIHQLAYGLMSPVCLLCGHPTYKFNFCTDCRLNLPILPHTCAQCGHFLLVKSINCGRCLTTPPPFDRTFTLFPYEPPIIQLIIQLKFQHQLSHARAFGELLTEAIQNSWYTHTPLPDMIIPIPLHTQRLRARGFNQSLEIAKPISKLLAIPIDMEGIKRTKSTFPQSSLPAKKRKENIANAFTVNRDYTGLSLAVIDDVITTGHTVTECARMLKQHGAKHIDIWCCARRG